MEKKPFTVLHFNQTKPKKQKRETLVQEKWLRHLEEEGYVLASFVSEKNHATFVFVCDGVNIAFELDDVVDTLILDFDGSCLTETQRLQASRLLERMIESLRFRYKTKYWSLSHYYIGDIAQYEERKEADYPAKLHQEWIRIANLAKIETMDDADRLFMQVEEVHDLHLKIVGIDGEVLCRYLQEIGLVTYEAVGENEWNMEFTEPLDELAMLNRKIVFARELAYFGYNVWVDYLE